jgi:hypothetical protein
MDFSKEARIQTITHSQPDALLDAMKAYRPPLEAVRRWMRQD